MAPTPPPPSLDEIVKKGREKKRNEALAKSIFGAGRKQEGRASPRTLQPAAGSLLSRVTKPGARRTSSFPGTTRPAAIPRTQTPLGRAAQNGKIDKAVGELRDEEKTMFSIKGASRKGPHVVVGSNFAPGTTDADIRAAMEPVGGPMLACAILTSSPTVIAEMVFSEKSGADAVVARFNNQRADGRLLYFYHKSGPPQTPIPEQPSIVDDIVRTTRGSTSLAHVPQTRLGEQRLGFHNVPDPIRNDLGGPPNQVVGMERNESNGMVDVDVTSPVRGRNGRRAEPAFQDGTMGFPSDEAMEVVEPERALEPSSEDASGGHHESRGGRDVYRSSGRYDDRYDHRRAHGPSGRDEVRQNGRDDARLHARGGYRRDSPRDYEDRAPRGDRNLYSGRYQRGGYRDSYR